MASDSADSRRSKLPPAANTATTSAFQTPIQAAIQHIRAPIALGDISETAPAVAELEEARARLLDGAHELEQQQRQLDTIQREHTAAHGITPPGFGPSRLGHVQRRGRAVGEELAGVPSPIYSSPARNMRASRAAAANLHELEGEELRQQQHRVQELLDVAHEQQTSSVPPTDGSVLAGSQQDDRRLQVGGPRQTHQASLHGGGNLHTGRLPGSR